MQFSQSYPKCDKLSGFARFPRLKDGDPGL